MTEASPGRFRSYWMPLDAPGPLPAGQETGFRPLRAYLCQQVSAAQIDIGQRQGDEGAVRILREPAIAYLREAPKPLDHGEYVFDAGPDPRLVAVLAARHLVDYAVATRALIREVARFGALP